MKVFLVLVLCACALFAIYGATEVGNNNGFSKTAERAGIHQFFQASPHVYSGSQPEGEASFAYLSSLGIKTILSVDGSKPDLEGARKHGIRYIHLPYGYDGIPTNRVAELVKLAEEIQGPIFVHCHHGKHRGPAAVAVLCRSMEGWTGQQATQFMARAGTSRDYPGLFEAAESFRKPSREELKRITALPELSPTPPLVDVMVEIDGRFDSVKTRIQSFRSSQTNQVHVEKKALEAAAKEATLLWEQLHEHARSVQKEETRVAQQDREHYLKLIEKSEQAALALKAALSEGVSASVDDASERFLKEAERRLRAVTESCTECHRAFRNPKRK